MGAVIAHAVVICTALGVVTIAISAVCGIIAAWSER